MPARRPKHTHCCGRFRGCVAEGSIHYCGKDDETEWAVQGFYHLYYCPFCGTPVKGTSWGDDQKNDLPNRRPPDKQPGRAGRSARGGWAPSTRLVRSW